MDKGKGLSYLNLSLLAFAGLGIEVLLVAFVEPMIYGAQMNAWSTAQMICHWVITCVIWAVMAVLLILVSTKKYNFNVFEKTEKMAVWQWCAVTVCLVATLAVSSISWQGVKVFKEFINLGILKFAFQYIYYIFETGLFVLIIVFGQKAFEKWFKNKKLPYGGIVVALTWGLVHMFTKGDLATGLLAAFCGILYGVVYLLTNKDIKKTFVIVGLMFIL